MKKANYQHSKMVNTILSSSLVKQLQGMKGKKKLSFLHNPWNLFTFATCQQRTGL